MSLKSTPETQQDRHEHFCTSYWTQTSKINYIFPAVLFVRYFNHLILCINVITAYKYMVITISEFQGIKLQKSIHCVKCLNNLSL